MPYVPGYSNDIFLSYAHGDDPAWFQAFEQSLTRAVRARLGQSVDLWQDVKRLRVGQDWENEIDDAISTTAAFVAVLSPSYQNSAWCNRELTSFLGPGGSLDAVKVRDLHRLLKVVKIPWEDNDHEAFYPRLQHVPFFRKVDDPREYVEFALSSEAFDGSLQELSAAITTILRTMRRSLQMVFVAAPAEDVADAWTRVRKQLLDDRYDVRPSGVLTAAYDDKVILRDVENAVLTVHLLGPSYDAFAERQLRLSAEAGRRQLVWFSKGAEREEQVDPKQWKLFESIRRKEGLQAGLDWFPGTIQEMIAQVQTALHPKKTEAAADPAGATRVYLLHDPTTRADAEFAAGLQAQLRDKERLDVVFPPAGLSSMTEYHDRHKEQLQNCDGVLLYWNAAPETWFEQYIPDVLFQGRKARARSKAFLLDDPTQMDQQGVPVIRRSPDFQLSDLEPFLKPLRAGEVSRVGA